MGGGTNASAVGEARPRGTQTPFATRLFAASDDRVSHSVEARLRAMRRDPTGTRDAEGVDVPSGSTALHSVSKPRPLARVPHDVPNDVDLGARAPLEWLAEAPIGFALLDGQQRFREVNEKLATIDGLARADHVGRTARELLPGMPRLLDAIERVLRSGEGEHAIEVTGRTRASVDRAQHLRASLVPVREGRSAFVALFVEDVTKVRELEHRHQLLEQRTHNAAVIRERILAIASHDVRAPLATIVSCIDQVSRKFPIADRWRQTRVLLDTVRRSVERVHECAAELHDLALLQTGRMPVQLAAHDVFALVSQAMRVLEPLAEGRVLRLESDVSAGAQVRCDRERIHRVLSVLVRHAIERTPAGLAVTLRVEHDCDVVRFVVREGGTRGEDETNDARAFERAWRPEGLALQITREIVRAHGGEFGVHGELGAGEVTYFTLPCVAR